jgi:hypothetical protein
VLVLVALGCTAVSRVVVVVETAAGFSDAQEIRNMPARIENSEVRMIGFFIVGWS